MRHLSIRLKITLWFSGALVLVVLDDTQRSTLYCMIPFVACCYAAYYALERQRKRENNA